MNAKLRRRLAALEEKSGGLLEKIQSGALSPKSRLPVIVCGYLGSADLRFSTCRRTLSPNGALLEYVWLRDEHGDLASRQGLPDEELHRWIASFPIEPSNPGANEWARKQLPIM